MELPHRRMPLKIAGYYALFAGLWILFSDRLLGVIITDPEIITRLQTVKGWLFVAVTALLLHVLIRRFVDEVHQREHVLRERNEEICMVEEELRQQLDEYERSRHELHESEARFRRLMEQAADAFFVHDETGHFIDVNEQACQTLGYSRDELLGMTIADVDACVSAEQVPVILGSLSPGEHQTVTGVHRRKDGTEFPVEVRVGIFTVEGRKLYLSLARDVSERQAMAAALREREESYRLLFASNPHPMWLYDLETLAFLEVNDAAVAHYGWSREEFLAMTIGDIRPPEDVPALMEKLKRVTSGIDRAGFWRHRTKDGTVIWVQITSHTLDFAGRRAELVLAGDVTERLRAEDEIRSLNAKLEERVLVRTQELERANREMESFSYSVSHDLRAPLRHIDGFSRALLEDCAGQLDLQGKGYLSRICAAANRMGQLIDDLLQLASVSRSDLQKGPVSLSNLARAVAAELKRTDPERDVTFTIAGGVQAEGDPLLLRVVLENLLGNAWKYTGKEPSAVIEFGVTEGAEGRAFYVRDNGVGFDMAYVHKLFSPFQRLHGMDEFEGTGIGLATVRRVVERHGGRAWAEGVLGSGATLFFTLGEFHPPADGDEG